jgi:hypothetical protein
MTETMQELTTEQAMDVNGGGSSYELGKSYGGGWSAAVQNEGMISSFQLVTDFFYGNW